MENKSNVILSISMLVSNRQNTIRNCMEGLRPLLESVPSELIIVDTVGEDNSDGSLAIAKEYATKVVHFDWCNDFSAARNAGFFEAQGEWFMYQDDDEWFDDVSEIILFFKSGEYKKYNSASYRTKDYYNLQGDYSTGVAHRMIKIENDTKFVRPVHEHLAPMKMPCKAFSSFTNHYGYVFSTPEKRKSHSQRNISLLEPEFDKNPWDMHVRMQLIQEYIFMEELQKKAMELCEETFEEAKEDSYKTREFQWIMVAYIRQANREKDYEAILKRAKVIREKFPIGVLADYAICIMEANAYCYLKQYEKGEEKAQEALYKKNYMLKNRDIYEYQRVLDLESFMDDSMYGELLRFRTICLYQLGDLRKAKETSKERFHYMSIPVLTISVLVSNHKNTVRKCLDSVKPLLEAIPSELIIVDTVGEEKSDGSLAIAKEYTNHIVHFSWCDDFAAARNAGLQEAKGEWFLYLDDDEWFENVEGLIQFFVSGEYLNYRSASYVIRNYQDKQGLKYNDTATLRMVHRTNKTAFIGCVNETFNSVYEPHRELGLYVHHYGFVYETQEAKQARMQYTLQLLHKDLEVYQGNLRNRLQLAIVLSVQNPERAIILCEETLLLCQDKKETEAYQKVEQLLNNLYVKYPKNERAEKEKLDEVSLELQHRFQRAKALALVDSNEALEYCKETFRHYAEQKQKKGFQGQLSLVFRLYETMNCSLDEIEQNYHSWKQQFGFNEVTENSICYQMTRICILKDEPEKGYLYAIKYFETWFSLQQNSTESYLEMLHFGAYCAFKAKAYKTAWSWYELMPWETPGYSNVEGLSFAMQLYRENINQEILFDIIKRIMKNGQEMQNEAVKAKISEALSMIKKTAEDGNASPDWIKSNIKLTIGVLVSNNVSTIRNCMESLRPILESVSSELIVVDTVGEENSDGSIAIAKEYATKVIRFEWCNDFSAARNVCIDQASGEWFLYVDDDEWFDDVEELIKFFNSGECDRYGQALLHIHNYTANGNFTSAVIGRLYRRTLQTRFVGRIHEALQPIYPPCKLLSIFLHHTGYVYANEMEKKRHQERNLSLLWQEVSEKGYTPYICAQIAQELLHVRDTWNEGLAFCQKVIPVLVEEQGTIKNASTQWILVSTARYFSLINNYEDLLVQVKYLQDNYILSEMSKLFLAAIVTKMAWDRKDYSVVENNVEKYFEAKNWLDNHPEQALQQSQLDFGNFNDIKVMLQILHIGAMCANEQKKYELANSYWKRFPWEQEGLSKEVYWEDMNCTMVGLKELQAENKRKERIKEILPLLLAVKEAEDCAEKFIDTENNSSLSELLSGMQEAVITVGTSVDEIIGEGSEEVSLLETYCEMVWQCNCARFKEEKKKLLEQMRNVTVLVTEKMGKRL